MNLPKTFDVNAANLLVLKHTGLILVEFECAQMPTAGVEALPRSRTHPTNFLRKSTIENFKSTIAQKHTALDYSNANRC